MPTFDTAESISVTINLVIGDVQISASDRTDTVVDVGPTDGSNESDLKAAELTRVEYAGGTLLVKAPKQRGLGFLGKPGSVDVTIALPAGSHVRGEASVATFRCHGRLGECRFKTALGDIQLDETGALHLNTSVGDITVDRANGNIEGATGSGTVLIREIDGSAVLKNSNGDIRVGEVTGDLRLNTANGGIFVDRALTTATAKTANGDIRFGEVVRGSVVLETGMGELEVGIREGTAARLDVGSRYGRVHNSLDASNGPEPSDETVEVRARTSFGDISIRRS